jgi:exosortase
VVAVLFTVTGTPFYREGYVFALPTVAIEIADECSGIRSSLALGITALLAGHAFLERSWSRLLLLLLVLPIAVFKNAVRIAGLSLLATHVDPGFLTGQLHHEGGFVFFGMALVLLMAVLHLLQKAETRRTALVPSEA